MGYVKQRSRMLLLTRQANARTAKNNIRENIGPVNCYVETT